MKNQSFIYKKTLGRPKTWSNDQNNGRSNANDLPKYKYRPKWWSTRRARPELLVDDVKSETSVLQFLGNAGSNMADETFSDFNNKVFKLKNELFNDIYDKI